MVDSQDPVPIAATVVPVAARTAPRKKTRARQLIAVGGGKGGIGKSLVSANLGIALSQRGAKVVLLDADLGGANLHTCLGVPQPAVTLSDFVNRRVASLDEVCVATGIERLSLISGAFDTLDAANLKHAQKQKLLRHTQALDVDYVILDLGAGTHFNVLDFFLLADRGIVVLQPEPTAIENAYRFIKAAFFRKVQLAQEELGLADWISQIAATRPDVMKTPWDLYAAVREHSQEAATRLELSLRGFRPHIVVNQARTRGDHEIGQAIVGAWKKFFGIELGLLGTVMHDDAVWRSVRTMRPVLIDQPTSPAAQGLYRVAENLLALDT